MDCRFRGWATIYENTIDTENSWGELRAPIQTPRPVQHRKAPSTRPPPGLAPGDGAWERAAGDPLSSSAVSCPLDSRKKAGWQRQRGPIVCTTWQGRLQRNARVTSILAWYESRHDNVCVGVRYYIVLLKIGSYYG